MRFWRTDLNILLGNYSMTLNRANSTETKLIQRKNISDDCSNITKLRKNKSRFY